MSKWQGTVEIRGIAPDPYITQYNMFSFYDGDGDYLFDIQPFAGDGSPMDSVYALCGKVGQCFVLNVLGWDEYDQVRRRIRGSSIHIDLSGIDLG